ncbi:MULTISPECIES: hypothetical protein [unclassified Rummeliibacillus]|uniref:hypothetical protein n=1 Tax=unclassified Rummeliibacillus TaxID=2622809 RepID=UPI001314DB16|nr:MULTISPECIES: hypothetical protein [unclassified Rummeliibacillus]
MLKFILATLLFIIIGNLINTSLPIQYSMLMLIALPVLFFVIYHKIFNIRLFNQVESD